MNKNYWMRIHSKWNGSIKVLDFIMINRIIVWCNFAIGARITLKINQIIIFRRNGFHWKHFACRLICIHCTLFDDCGCWLIPDYGLASMGLFYRPHATPQIRWSKSLVIINSGSIPFHFNWRGTFPHRFPTLPFSTPLVAIDIWKIKNSMNLPIPVTASLAVITK